MFVDNDRFLMEKYNIKDINELDIFKQHGAKYLEKYQDMAKEYSSWRHKRNEDSFNNFKKFLSVIFFPVGLYNLHRKKVKKLNAVIDKRDKEIERLKLVIQRKDYHKNTYKGGFVEWDDNLLSEEMENIKDVKEA